MSQTNAWMWSEEFKRYYRSKGHDSQGKSYATLMLGLVLIV